MFGASGSVPLQQAGGGGREERGNNGRIAISWSGDRDMNGPAVMNYISFLTH